MRNFYCTDDTSYDPREDAREYYAAEHRAFNRHERDRLQPPHALLCSACLSYHDPESGEIACPTCGGNLLLVRP